LNKEYVTYFYIGVAPTALSIVLMVLDIHWIAMGSGLFMYLIIQNAINYYEY